MVDNLFSFKPITHSEKKVYNYSASINRVLLKRITCHLMVFFVHLRINIEYSMNSIEHIQFKLQLHSLFFKNFI